MNTLSLRLVPEDPHFIPKAECRAHAMALLKKAAPGATVDDEASDYPWFISPNNRVGSVSCPRCSKSLALDWWSNAMNQAWATKNTKLNIALPCCGHNVSLNDLTYEPHARFGQFMLELTPVESLSPETLHAVEDVLGCRLKPIYCNSDSVES